MSNWRDRPVWTLPCLERHLGSLTANGVRLVGDVDPDTFPEAFEAIRKAHDQAETTFETCLDLFDAHRRTEVGLLTFSDGVDAVLGEDGLMPGKVTEIYGQAGSGKTQLCLQLCANVQLPTVIGGLGGKVLFLDTEGGFTPQRMSQVAQKTCKNAQKIFTSSGTNYKQSLVRRLSEEAMMAGVFYKRVRSSSELEEILSNDVEEFLRQHLDVRLVIVDSLAFPFRYDLVDEVTTSQASHALQRVGQRLHFLAADYNLVVVVINHVTSRDGQLVPALGDTWAHTPNVRISLSLIPTALKTRKITMIKTSGVLRYNDDGSSVDSAEFCVTSGGIRDAVA